VPCESNECNVKCDEVSEIHKCLILILQFMGRHLVTLFGEDPVAVNV
jgi:hypothetical protein